MNGWDRILREMYELHEVSYDTSGTVPINGSDALLIAYLEWRLARLKREARLYKETR